MPRDSELLRESVFLSVLIPAYNEERSIAQTLLSLSTTLRSNGWRYEIIVASDGSKDKTVEIASNLGLDNVRVLDLYPNQGKGAALLAAFQTSRGKYAAFFDADGDIAVESLVDLFKRLLNSDADIIVGSKVHPESMVQYPKLRRIQSYGFRLLIRLLFSIPVSDTQTGVKVFRSDVLDQIAPGIDSSGFEFDLELIVSAVKQGYSIIDGPVRLNFQFESTVRPRDAYFVLRGTIRTRRKFSLRQ